MWGGITILRLASFWIHQGVKNEVDHQGREDKSKASKFIIPPYQSGWGPRKVKSPMVTEMAENMDRGVPVSLGKWAKWDADTQKSLEGKLIGCSVSQSTKYNYSGYFRRCGTYRSVNGLIPYLGLGNGDLEREEG